MSSCQPLRSTADITPSACDADSIIRDLRVLRDQIVTAWRERAVVLSTEEQALLHSEITQTCAFLTDLTRNP